MVNGSLLGIWNESEKIIFLPKSGFEPGLFHCQLSLFPYLDWNSMLDLVIGYLQRFAFEHWAVHVSVIFGKFILFSNMSGLIKRTIHLYHLMINYLFI